MRAATLTRTGPVTKPRQLELGTTLRAARLGRSPNLNGPKAGGRSLVSGSAPENRLQYDSQYQDAQTQQYNLRAREYDPTTGRFNTTDPLDNPPATPAAGTYTYAGDDPVLFDDPTGLSCWLCHAATAALSDVRTGAIAIVSGGGQAASSIYRKVVSRIPSLQQTSDFTAGFGDFITFGGTDAIRRLLGVNDVVNHCSTAYQFGIATALIAAAPVAEEGLSTAESRLSRLRNRLIKRLGGAAEEETAADATFAGRDPRFASNFSKIVPKPGDDFAAHHVFPVQFGQDFLDIGINVNNPEYGTWVDTSLHAHFGQEYASEWASFFSGGDVTRGEAFAFARQLAGKFGFGVHF